MSVAGLSEGTCALTSSAASLFTRARVTHQVAALCIASRARGSSLQTLAPCRQLHTVRCSAVRTQACSIVCSQTLTLSSYAPDLGVHSLHLKVAQICFAD